MPSLHLDIAEVQTAEGKLRVFVAIDRSSKFACTELHQEAGKMVAAQFLRDLIAAVPCAIHTVLTDNGIRFTNHARHKYAEGKGQGFNVLHWRSRCYSGCKSFDSKGQTVSSVVLAQLMNLAVTQAALQQFAQRLRRVRKPGKRSHDLKPHVSVTVGTR